MEIKEKYINLFTDFGFKRVFGEEANKELAKFNKTLAECTSRYDKWLWVFKIFLSKNQYHQSYKKRYLLSFSR